MARISPKQARVENFARKRESRGVASVACRDRIADERALS